MDQIRSTVYRTDLVGALRATMIVLWCETL